MRDSNDIMNYGSVDRSRCATLLGTAAMALVLLWGTHAEAQGFDMPPPAPDPADELLKTLPPPTKGLKFPEMPLPPGMPRPSSNLRDLEGVWFNANTLQFRIQKDMYGDDVPFNLAGAKVLARRVNSLPAGTPYINASTLCRPPGQVWQLDINNPFHIYQSADLIEIPFEMYHSLWKISLNDAGSSEDHTEYMGRSVGHWEGNTLIVETRGFKQDLWLDVNGTPASANAKLTQRIRKVLDQGDPFLEIVTTIDDPAYYKRPWSIARTFAWRPNMLIFSEFNCEEQIGDPNYLPASGLIPEPKD